VGAGTITDLTSPLTEVEEVVNYRSAFDGDDEEPLSDTMLRAPREIKARDRAVTLEDFALLAKETPGALVARAYAYVTDSNGMDSNGGRIINVVIVPQSQEARPVPDEAARRRVCRYLDERRLITTQVRVKGPKYHDIDVIVDVRARADADLKEVKNAIDARLAGYFHPLRGGEDGKGWPFGRDVYYSELLREIMVISGVVRVEDLKLRKLLARCASEEQAESQKDGIIQTEDEAFPDACVPGAEVIRAVEEAEDDSPQEVFYVAAVYDCCDLPVAEGALVALRRAEIAVSYDRRGGR
jgi:predicted phage baseplate assembly protein